MLFQLKQLIKCFVHHLPVSLKEQLDFSAFFLNKEYNQSEGQTLLYID